MFNYLFHCFCFTFFFIIFLWILLFFCNFFFISFFAVGVTSTVSAFSRGILNTVSDGFAGIVNRGSDQRNTKNKSYKTYSYNQKNKNNNNNQKNKKSGAFFKLSNLGFNFRKQNNHYRGQNVNPWKPFWHFISVDKKQEKKKIPWFSTVNFNSQNIGNKISLD